MDKVIKLKDRQGDSYVFFCKGCDMMHIIPVNYVPECAKRNGKDKPIWHFNGDMEKPTFNPSIRVDWKGAQPPQTCHFIIRDGWIIYLVETTHALCGKRMPMEDQS